MWKRTTFGEDPWVTIQTNNNWPIEDYQMVYGEISSEEHNQILRAHEGMDVFIRKIKGKGGVTVVRKVTHRAQTDTGFVYLLLFQAVSQLPVIGGGVKITEKYFHFSL